MAEENDWRLWEKRQKRPFVQVSADVVEAVYYPELKVERGEFAQMPPSVQAPQNFTMQGGTRKLVVLRDDDRLVVVVGHELYAHSPQDYYAHRALVDLAREDGCEGLFVSGGGEVRLTGSWKKGETGQPEWRWQATFEGSSGDFGEFDKNLVLNPEVVEALARQMGLDIYVEQKYYARGQCR